MASPWIIWVGSESNNKCTYKKHAGERYPEEKQIIYNGEIGDVTTSQRTPRTHTAGRGKE